MQVIVATLLDGSKVVIHPATTIEAALKDVPVGASHEVMEYAQYLAEHPIAPVVPQTVTRFQALAALHLAGKLTAVQAIMAAPEAPVLAKLAWENALSFERNSPTLASLAPMVGMTSADLDALFTAAAQIEA